ncbi:MAG: extracellular solute-binding protein, partial [Clostridiales bacterium]|nr:extracellular solute-binding protein [Clostridiales bacterium]
ILPYPVFRGEKKVALQRGGGMCVTRSTKEKEHAAGVFLKWFTSPRTNLRFISSTGYLPVTEEAFGDIMSREIDNVPDENIKKLLKASRTMQQEYEFCVAPLFDDVDMLQQHYESLLKETATRSRQAYLDFLETNIPDEAYEKAIRGLYEEFSQSFSEY